MDLASVDLVEKLHEDKGVEDDGVVLRGRGVERSVAAAVDVKHALAWRVRRTTGNEKCEEKKNNMLRCSLDSV